MERKELIERSKNDKLRKVFNKHFSSQDLEAGIYEIVLVFKHKDYTFYGVSELECENNALDFLEQVYFNSDILELWKELDN
jgi:hypothetical protein